MEPDVLGAPYRRRVIDLGSDDEGPVSATLVRRLAEPRTGRAVLYLHGFVDYFFQNHLADFYVEHGIDFYALDLRKYGRSLAPHQTPNHCHDLRDYYPELDEAARIIRDEDDHGQLLVNGHSTGGLIAALWAHDRRDSNPADALFLNSPFLDLNAPPLLRRVASLTARGVARARPYGKLPFSLNEVYGRSIHHEYGGEWIYDLAWKPLGGFPVRAGWLRAIRAGQLRVHAGLDVEVPILVAASGASYKRARWSEAAREADSVLDVDHMARWAPALGRCVTLIRVPGGLHDLTLSAEPARTHLFGELERWLSAYFALAADTPANVPADGNPDIAVNVPTPASAVGSDPSG